MEKILVIGQMPPHEQMYKVPYDKTMLYYWFEEVGISKEKVQEMCTFDVVYDKFLGKGTSKNHIPTAAQMTEYYEKCLKKRIEQHDRILVLGKTATSFLVGRIDHTKKKVQFTMDPSHRNGETFVRKRREVLTSIRNIIN